MAKYRFRLETIEKLRVIRRDQQRVALAEALRAEQVLIERRADIQNEQAALRTMQRAASAQHHVDVNRLLDAQRYELVLNVRKLELTNQQALLSTEIERRRRALVEADREVRVLELLDERQRQAHRREMSRLETRQLDEIASQQHERNIV
jgi:flagellar protein FliJ